MDLGRIVKWLVVIALLAFAWKVAVPWVKEKGGKGGDESAAQGSSSCAGLAERASESWGNGLHQFINPPYDVEAWSRFQSGVESDITRAESGCICAAKSCSDIRDAMRDLRGLVSEMGTAIRSGSSPPADAVQRQEAIDNRIAGARAQLQSGQ